MTRGSVSHDAAAWLEAHGLSDALGLSEHFERGEMPARAVRHYRQLALHALGGNDFTTAATRAARGAQWTSNPALRVEFLVIQAEALRWIGKLAEAESAVQRAFRAPD